MLRPHRAGLAAAHFALVAVEGHKTALIALAGGAVVDGQVCMLSPWRTTKMPS